MNLRSFVFIIIVLLSVPSVFSAFFTYSSNAHGLYDGSGSICLASNTAICSSFGTGKYQYNTLNSENWLTSTACSPQVSTNKVKGNFAISGQKSLAKTYLVNTGRFDVLNNNLWMKVRLTYKLYDGSAVEDSYVINNHLLTDQFESIPPHTFNPTDFGNYVVKVTVTPTDSKCDSFGSSATISNFDSFSVTAASCSVHNTTLNHGESQYFYSEEVSATCIDKGLRTCNDGSLSGTSSYIYSSCKLDSDSDGLIDDYDSCDNTPSGLISHIDSNGCHDTDSDTRANNVDNCPLIYNINQSDFDTDGIGDICDDDIDGDGFQEQPTSVDFCPNQFGTALGCPDTDGDNVRNSEDLCPAAPGDPTRGGCPIYSLSGACQGAMSFDQNTQALSCFSDMQKTDNNYNCGVGSEGNCGWTDIPGAPSVINPDTYGRGEQRYLCVEEDSGALWWYEPEKVQGYCDLDFNPILTDSDCVLPDVDATEIESGIQKRLFKQRIYEHRSQVQFIDVICNNGQLYSGGSVVNPIEFRHLNYFQLGPDTLGTIIDTTTGTIESDEDTRVKLTYDIENSTLTYNGPDGTQTVDTTVFDTTNKNIKIYKDGFLDREEEVDPVVIALKATQVRKFKDSTELVNYVNKSVDVMTKFEIVKNLTYNSFENKTKVQIRMQDVPQSVQQNITIYQVISKDLAESIDDINFISDGGAQRIIIDKDPVIGWYFNDSEDNESIEYELEGESEGGTIIITQEPILYNEGELIINYREGGCNPGEAYLFDLPDLEDSVVYAPGSGQTYNVCIAHLTETLYANDAHTPTQHLFSYTTASNASIDDSYGVSSADVSVDQTSPNIYWSMHIQDENPNGNYSCLGSIENDESSLFGDCGYTNNRIWLHLGEDYYPPNTSLSYPYLSHSVRVELDAEDNIGGSGVDKTYYCFDDTGECNPIQEYIEPFTITCEYDWGCVKFVRFYSIDIEGNQEEIKTQNIRILDKGSACSSDCTAKPSPNRYLKECRNLNSCTYFAAPWETDDEKGEYVAEQCDFLIKDSWVAYNETHDIQCPSGPLRLTKFTALGTDTSASFCQNVIKTPYITLFDGQQVIMNVLSCAN